eukprot:COSAG02_NODE_8308_length_2623_cov_1.870048_1_plen_270_part_00
MERIYHSRLLVSNNDKDNSKCHADAGMLLFRVCQAEKQAEQNREEEERKAKAARKEARRAARLAARGKAHTVSRSPSASPAAGATPSWDSTDTSSVTVSVNDVKKAELRASLELAVQLQAEDFDDRVPKRKRAPPETFVAEPSKQMKVEASPKEHVRMREDDTENAIETGDAESAEADMDMISLSSDDESFSSEMQKPKAKKAKREKKPKVLTEAEHAAKVMPSLLLRVLVYNISLDDAVLEESETSNAYYAILPGAGGASNGGSGRGR